MYSRELAKLNLDLSILRTCKIISQECLKILHENNHYIHLSNHSLFHHNQQEWRFLEEHLHTSLEHHLLNPATTMPFFRNIRHLELRFGKERDFANVLYTMSCIRDEIWNLKTLGLEFLSVWNQSDIKHVLQTLKRIRVSHKITISTYQRKDWYGQSIFENMEWALLSSVAVRRYNVTRPEAQPKHDEDLPIDLDLNNVRCWVLVPR